MADYAIHDTTLIGTSNIIRKKEGSSALIDPADYPKRINLMGMLEEKTIVSSPIADFSDGADDVPTKSLVVTIPPTLSGISSVTETQTGRNLLDTAISETKTHNSVSITCDGNGKYTASGTATGGSANVTFTLETPCKIKSGMYFHAMNSVANGNASITLQRQDNSTIMYFSLSPTNRIVDLSSYAGETVYSIRFYVVNGASFEMQLTPMVCFSSTAHAYEPYTTPTTYTASLGRTIYGGQADIVNGVGTDGYGIITFDGSSDENWGGYSAYNGYYIGISDMKSGTRQDGVCNQLTCSKSTAQGQTDAFWLGVGNKILYVIGVYDSMGSTLEAFKAYLAENPLILVYPLETPTDFTFDGQEIPTRLGYNAFWSEQGDTEVTYRGSGTITPVVPTLITKTITANDTYSAEDDDADGYSEVVVNVPIPSPVIEPIMGNNVFISQSGVSGTDVERTARTFNITKDGKIIFADGSYGYTNTGSNHGFIDIRHNDVSVVKQYLTTNTNTSITIPDIDVENGDTIAVVVGFDSNHSSCNFQLYSAMVMVSEQTPSLLSMGSPSQPEEQESEEEEEVSP